MHNAPLWPEERVVRIAEPIHYIHAGAGTVRRSLKLLVRDFVEPFRIGEVVLFGKVMVEVQQVDACTDKVPDALVGCPSTDDFVALSLVGVPIVIQTHLGIIED
jgi:hypothetical protein